MVTIQGFCIGVGCLHNIFSILLLLTQISYTTYRLVMARIQLSDHAKDKARQKRIQSAFDLL